MKFIPETGYLDVKSELSHSRWGYYFSGLTLGIIFVLILQLAICQYNKYIFRRWIRRGNVSGQRGLNLMNRTIECRKKMALVNVRNMI